MLNLEESIEQELQEFSEHDLNNPDMRRDVANAMASSFLDIFNSTAIEYKHQQDDGVPVTQLTYTRKELQDKFNIYFYWFYDKADEAFCESIAVREINPQKEFASLANTISHAHYEAKKSDESLYEDLSGMKRKFKNILNVYVWRYIGKSAKRERINQFFDRLNETLAKTKITEDAFAEGKAIHPLPDTFTCAPTLPKGTALYSFDIRLNPHLKPSVDIEIHESHVTKVELDYNLYFRHKKQTDCNVNLYVKGDAPTHHLSIKAVYKDRIVTSSQDKVFYFKREDAISHAKALLSQAMVQINDTDTEE